jgi:hypothetical protein
MARAARHPGPLLLREVEIDEIARTYGTPVWAVNVSAADGSFAVVRILLLDGGSPLAARLAKASAAPHDHAAELRRQAAAANPDAVGQLDRLRAGGPLVRPVNLSNGRLGYAAVLGIARDSITVATLLPSPDGRYETLVTVDAPFQHQGAAPTPELGRYRTRLSGEPLESVQEMAMSVYRQLFPARRRSQ